jgi:hypothetical protein
VTNTVGLFLLNDPAFLTYMVVLVAVLLAAPHIGHGPSSCPGVTSATDGPRAVRTFSLPVPRHIMTRKEAETMRHLLAALPLLLFAEGAHARVIHTGTGMDPAVAVFLSVAGTIVISVALTYFLRRR